MLFLLPACATPGPSTSCSPTGCGCVRSSTDASAGDLTVTFHGVSTLMFDDATDQLLIDGFFSRPPAWQYALLMVSDRDRVLEGLGAERGRLRAVLFAHAHHDHALDLAMIADIERSARLVGTPSVAALALRNGADKGRVCAPADEQTLRFGGYDVTAFDVDHGPGLPVIGPLIDRPMISAPSGPAPFWRFLDDENRSYLIGRNDRTILVHPSAGRRKRAMPAADVVYLGIGRLGLLSEKEANEYLDAVVTGMESVVVPIHWDNFSTPLGDTLVETPPPLDDVENGFGHLCRWARTRPGLVIVRPQYGATLTLDGATEVRLDDKWSRLCPRPQMS